MTSKKIAIEFGRDICGNLADAEKKEWLVTNGIGGFASGTIAGTLTRRYHGLLLAALRPPRDRTLLVTKFDETIYYNTQEYPLYSNNWLGETTTNGYTHIERFYLEGTTPVWHYTFADALLEKRIWMQQGANTTYVHYTVRRASAALTLVIMPLVNYRHYHDETQASEWQMHIEPVDNGLKIIAYDGAIPFYLLSDRAKVIPRPEWHYRYFLIREANRGLMATDDNLSVGQFEIILQPGQSVLLAASIDATPNLNGPAAYAERRTYETTLKQHFETKQGHHDTSASLQQLILAADQFIVKRSLPDDPHGRSVIAGYHWFGDWGRDTMIALPGLTLTTGRPEIAAKILRTFAFYINGGMLPNRFPNAGDNPEYNTADAALWYIEAMRAYHAATGDDDFISQLFPVLVNIIGHYRQGTRFNIHVDPQDDLLYAGEEGQQLTWMDAKIEEWVVTPRMGKPVEINALWYNALCIMRDFAQFASNSAEKYAELAQAVQHSFGRFWHEDLGYCYDVLDTPAGNDATLRPNQLLAVSLPHSPLTPIQQKAIVNTCAHTLLTSHGLRTLAPDQPNYQGSYGGDLRQRDRAYHQGTVWAWLIGPFVRAHLRVYNDKALARSYLEPLLQTLTDHGLGSISEIFDGDQPFPPRGAIAHATGIAELLVAWQLTTPDIT